MEVPTWRAELVATVGEGENRASGESSINIYAVAHVRWILDEKLLSSTGIPGSQGAQVSSASDHEGGRQGKEGFGGRERRDGGRLVTCIIMAD